MQADFDRERHYVLDALERYWPGNADVIAALPLPALCLDGPEPLPPQFRTVGLPEWAVDLGINGALLVPARFCQAPDWQQIDWLGAAYWYLAGLAERAHEAAHGPVHSYSLRLAGWDPRMWDRAWVNRIALFLRRWAGLKTPLPKPQILLTHDVDAIGKTLAIRCKQSAFQVLNAARILATGRPLEAGRRLAAGIGFFVRKTNYRTLALVAELEERHGLRSHFNVYGGGGGPLRSPKLQLLDPGYDACEYGLAQELRGLAERGWTIGLHQSFGSWCDAGRMLVERERVEAAVGGPVTSCRQHWLRFSWERTWQAQVAASLRLDTTLGFNDRPGFRAGAALKFRPWDPVRRESLSLEALPMVLMDSHLYDYLLLSDSTRQIEMKRWLDEVRAVGGEASIIWHPHVLNEDYGWESGFMQLLELVATA